MKFKSLALACALATAAPAFADTVNLSGYTFGGPSTVSVASPSYSGGAGQFTGLLNGNSFVTYCTDLLQTFHFNVNYTDYSIVNGAAAWGATKSADLDRALSALVAASYPIDADTSAVAQSMVWEILYETSGSYGFGTGTFKVTSGDAGVTAQLGLVNWANLPLQTITYHADQLYSREHQDFLVLTAVPEPGTYALFATGLAGVAFIARRRAHRA